MEKLFFLFMAFLGLVIAFIQLCIRVRQYLNQDKP